MSGSSKTKNKRKSSTHWDAWFAQWLETLLPTLGLEVIKKIQLGKLPLEADLVIIRRSKENNKWRIHALWKHLTHHSLIEFKSISDPLEKGDLQKLFAYASLYFIKADLSYSEKLSTWLILPQLNHESQKAFKYHHIELMPIVPGFWQGFSTYPFFVVEYNVLPLEADFADMKLFMKEGQPLKAAMALALKRLSRQPLLHDFVEIAKKIHLKEIQEVLKMAVQNEPTLYELYDSVLLEAGPEKSKTYQEGEAEGIRRTLVLQAQSKFKQLPKAVVTKIQTIHDVSKLEKLATVLLTVDSLEAFKKLL